MNDDDIPELPPTFDRLQSMWSKDAYIDDTNLKKEALKIPKLHAKYWPWFIRESLSLKALESKRDTLVIEKRMFYYDGPTAEQNAAGWKLPAQGCITVYKEIHDFWIPADKDYIELSQKIAAQQAKVKYLDSIIKSIMNRNFEIRASIDAYRYLHGGEPV